MDLKLLKMLCKDSKQHHVMFHKLDSDSSLLCIAQNVRFEIPYKVLYFETPFLMIFKYYAWASYVGDLTLRTRWQSSKMPTAHLFLYLVDFGTALSTQSSSSSIVFGQRNLPSAMAKTICKSLQVQNAFGIQIWCNAKLLDN